MKKEIRRKEKAVIGWREVVSLPELGIGSLEAKVDTGARTSALHATAIRQMDQDGKRMLEFEIPATRSHRAQRYVAPLVDARPIKNTGGVAEIRYVIETTLVLGAKSWKIEISLADRENMKFDLILGRTAIRRRRLYVDPGRSFLAGPPGKQVSVSPPA
ncbi:MAG: RimK/LysX family protein [Parvibaculum sp.]